MKAGLKKNRPDSPGPPAAPPQFWLRTGSLRGYWRRYRAPRRGTRRRPGVCAQCATVTSDAAAERWHYTARNLERSRYFQLCRTCAGLVAALAG